MKLNWRAGFLALILAASLYASIENLISTRDLGSVSDDPVADWQIRFAPLIRKLPFRRGVVGYISDSDIPGVAFNAANDEGEYVLTQYAVAPIVIVKGTHQEWNIGNLSAQAYQLWSLNNHGEFDVSQFKGGLYLLHKIGQ